jgi:hypothetical protein
MTSSEGWVPDYQEEFWGDRGLSRRENRIAHQADSAVAILTPLLEPDEALSVAGQCNAERL